MPYSKNGYEPVDWQSAAVKRQNRLVAISLLMVGAFVVIFGLHLRRQLFKENTTDDIFAAMLIDDKGFYFPTTLGASPVDRRFLQETMLPSIASDGGGLSWSYDWKRNIGASAAVGEYYLAKAAALSAYYGKSSASNSSDLLAFDWQTDDERGVALGEYYRAIGDTIDEHYKRIFSKQDPREMTSYDWKGDRNRGLIIGKYFHEIGKSIQKHYRKAFRKYRPNETVPTGQRWEDYQAQGEALASYYHNKSVSVGNYYKGRFADMWYMWNQNEDDGDTNIFSLRAELKEKGMAIGEYYRAKYDPTYKPDKLAQKDKYPPWGQDPEADAVHGQAIGAYYKKKHNSKVGEFYMKQGKEIGKYYSNYYRSMFDPTYAE